MFSSLRLRLLLGIAPLLAITVGLGLWAVAVISGLGGNIHQILRENYRSVLAAQNMKDALERMDSAILFAVGGRIAAAREQFDKARPRFEESLRIEQGNVTLAGEQELVDDLAGVYGRYVELAVALLAMTPSGSEDQARFYFERILPTFSRIKGRADDVLRINQRSMEEADRRARLAGSNAVRGMAVALAGSAVVATLIALILSRSILARSEG